MTGNSFFICKKPYFRRKEIKAMKKSSILILIIICLVGCKKGSNETTITGEIKGLGTDTLYLYGMDELYDRIDTIYVENDKSPTLPA